MIYLFSEIMSFGVPFDDLFQAFKAKYDLSPGFGGDFDLLRLFGDWKDDPSFVRDRVSTFLCCFSIIFRSFS